MKEGYSTAPDNVRALGFGAGMGLPNIKSIPMNGNRYFGRQGHNHAAEGVYKQINYIITE